MRNCYKLLHQKSSFTLLSALVIAVQVRVRTTWYDQCKCVNQCTEEYFSGECAVHWSHWLVAEPVQALASECTKVHSSLAVSSASAGQCTCC